MSLWTLKDSMSSKVTVRGSLQDLDEKMPVSISTTKRQRTNLHSEGKERIIRGHRHTDQTNMRKRKSKRDSVTLRLKVFLRQMRDRVKVRDRLSVKRDKMKEREKQSPYLLGNPAQNGSCILEHRSCFLAGQPVSMLHKSSILSVYYSLHSTASTYECKKTINNRYNEASPHCTLSFLHWDVCHNTEEKSMQCHYLRFIASLNCWLHCDFKLASWFVAYPRWFTRFSWIYPQRFFSFPYCMYTSWGMCTTNTMTYWTHTHHSFCPARITLLWLNTTRPFCTPPTVNKISELW